MMVSSSRKYPNGLTITVIVIIFSLTLFPSVSEANSMAVRDGDHQRLEKQMKMVLGSKPPGCVNRCVGCIPCTPTQVVSPPDKNNNLKATNTNQGDEGYYLLSWKCKCRNKLFEP
ncbi:hypothetical protein Pyn_11308 [Prunus yedoensis var. nudiflora]|uniref:Epidermal patterning factor-like protein n=2 Tax=Prunus yedoensis var. nudiflora TaxID=2094558 RepID=A0A314YSB7_PRUYE|nr:hypothetical protein Pyn_11308 [Prunus yedoensis var. nudiflora]